LPGRSGPLRLLVVGGSLGAQALNEVVPKALALIPPHSGRVVVHQSGATADRRIARQLRRAAGVQAELTPFIDDMARRLPRPTWIVCRAGASTVTEIAAVGAAALFVPFPFAVDDHQTTNASFLVDQGGGWLMQQSDLTPERWRACCRKQSARAVQILREKAKNMQKIDATRDVVAACEELAHETRHPPHPFRRHRRLRHERHRRGAAQPGLCDLGLGPGRQRHAAPPGGLGIQTHVGHAGAHVAGADAVVTSTAVRPTTPRCWPRATSAFPWCRAR
jgi:hypothetical protein